MGLCWKYGRFQTKYLNLKGRGLFTSGCLLSCDNQILITTIKLETELVALLFVRYSHFYLQQVCFYGSSR